MRSSTPSRISGFAGTKLSCLTFKTYNQAQRRGDSAVNKGIKLKNTTLEKCRCLFILPSHQAVKWQILFQKFLLSLPAPNSHLEVETKTEASEIVKFRSEGKTQQFSNFKQSSVMLDNTNKLIKLFSGIAYMVFAVWKFYKILMKEPRIA